MIKTKYFFFERGSTIATSGSIKVTAGKNLPQIGEVSEVAAKKASLCIRRLPRK
jgi:hypothetical protein